MEDLITFPGQFSNFRVTAIGDRMVTFRVDELYSESIKDIVSTPVGTEYVVTLVPVGANTDLKEVKETMARRFGKKLHAEMAELAELLDVSPEEVKNNLREELKQRGMIVESTTELPVSGLAIAVNIIEKWIADKRNGNTQS